MATGSLGRRWMPASTVCANLSMCACALIKHCNGSRFPQSDSTEGTSTIWPISFSAVFQSSPKQSIQRKELHVKIYVLLSGNAGGIRASSARCERQGIPFHVHTIWELQSVKKKKECHWCIISQGWWWNESVQLLNAPVLGVNSLKCNYCSLTDLNIISSLDYKPWSLIKKSALPIGFLMLYGKTLYHAFINKNLTSLFEKQTSICEMNELSTFTTFNLSVLCQ